MQTSWLREVGSMTAQPVMAPRGSIVPLRVGRALVALCWLVIIYGTLVSVPHHSSLRVAGAWIATAIFLTAFTVAVERQDVDYLLPVSALAAVVMQSCAPSNGAFVAVIAAMAVSSIRFDVAVSRRLATIFGVAFIAASVVTTPSL